MDDLTGEKASDLYTLDLRLTSVVSLNMGVPFASVYRFKIRMCQKPRWSRPVLCWFYPRGHGLASSEDITETIGRFKD